MARIVAIGNRAFVIALAGIGAEPVRCDTSDELDQGLRKAALQRDVQLVFVAEPMAAAVPEAMQAFRKRSRAALLALPLAVSDEHPSLNEVRHLIEQATGASLI